MKVIGISETVHINVAVAFQMADNQLLKCAKFLGWDFPIPCNTTLSSSTYINRQHYDTNKVQCVFAAILYQQTKAS